MRRIIVIIALLASEMAVLAADGFATPKMYWADSSRTGVPYAKDPSVIKFGGRYLMYFSLPPAKDKSVPAGWAVGIAESRNLTEWKRIGELLPGQECDKKGLAAPAARVLNGKVHLFYQTYGNGPKDAICHAVSDDGIKFVRDVSNPVFHPAGGWTSGRAIDADVIEYGDRLLLFCATRDPGMKIQMLAVAAADRKSDFGRDSWKQICSDTVLKPELSWEKKCIEAPSALVRDGAIYLFYAGGYNNEPQQIGCAMSRDGVNWKRLFEEPLLANGKSGEWNASESGHPGVFVDDDGQTYLFYQGNSDKGRTWYLSWVKIGWKDGKPYVIGE